MATSTPPFDATLPGIEIQRQGLETWELLQIHQAMLEGTADQQPGSHLFVERNA